MVTTLELDSFHTVHVDVTAGYGLLLCPSAETDVWLGCESVFGAAWTDAVCRLGSLGWVPLRDESGLLSYVGCTEDGRLVVEARSVLGECGVDGECWRSLCAAAGLSGERPQPHHPA